MDRGDAPGVTARTPIALTIAGSDSGGGAGVQADLKTFAALGVFGVSAIAALTAQNTRGVRAVHYAPPEIVAAQIEAVLSDFSVAAIKVGMLGRPEIVGAVAEALGCFPPWPAAGEGLGVRGRRARAPSTQAPRRDPSSGGPKGVRKDARLKTGYGPPPSPTRGEGGEAFIVYDPVLIASSGDRLIGAGFVEAIKQNLLPMVDCLTPNLAEAAALLGEPIAGSEADMARQGEALLALGPRAVLMKGGHLAGEEAVDLLVAGGQTIRFAAAKIASRNLHGTGCVLSSAIAAHVALGLGLREAVGAAKAFVRQAIEAGRDLELGAGVGPLAPARLARPGSPDVR